ncbi:RNA polymerase II transcription mediator [Actinidia rufa]|uniref:Mediator of RNA polymerase II transcription subunit 13 n=1 Tax=Actinidia rufa TaxID=165716 RepID=A0A7J0EEL2_9ERIC|nr:RNA polymerase II transcription mediator [Actinidia rufa]
MSDPRSHLEREIENPEHSSSKVRTSNGIVGLPCNGSQVPGYQVGGQSCYVEVTLGFPTTGNDKVLAAKLDRAIINWFILLYAVGSKRSRTGIAESFGQAVTNDDPMQDAYGSVEVNNSVITELQMQMLDRNGIWDDDGRGIRCFYLRAFHHLIILIRLYRTKEESLSKNQELIKNAVPSGADNCTPSIFCGTWQARLKRQSPSKNFYTIVEQHEKRLIAVNNGIATHKVAAPSSFPGFNYANAVKTDSTYPVIFLWPSPTGMSRLTGSSFLNQLHDRSSVPANVFRCKTYYVASMEICRPSLPSLPSEEGMLSYGQRQPLQEFLDGLALLVQQATSFVDVALDADCGDGPYGWLALQEQRRRGFSCGPSMVHAGCGGSLASCHSLDIAGVDLVDPLFADSLAGRKRNIVLDVDARLRTMGDGFSTELTGGECRDSSGTVTLPADESLSPSQSSAVGSSYLKDGARVDETSQWRSNQDTSASETEQQLGFRLRPTLFVLPLPAILVGYAS